MESYITLTKGIHNITGNNKLEMTLLIAGIKSVGNYQTHVTETTREYIADFTGISFRTVKSLVPKLTKNAGFIFDRIEKRYKSPNKYYFKEAQNYFFIKNGFFKEQIDTKVKGLLLLIKSLCIPETNKYISEKPNEGKLNHSELARKLKIDVKTLNKYLDVAIEKKQIKMIPKGLVIINKFIVPDFISKDSTTKLYHLIYYWCLEHDIIPPDRNDQITKSTNGDIKRNNSHLNAIIHKYSCMSEKDFLDLLDRRITEKENITLEYINAALNVKAIENNKSLELNICL